MTTNYSELLKQMASCWKTTPKVSPLNPLNIRKAYAATLGCHCHSNLEAISILMEREHDEEARIVIRSLIEVIFKLGAVKESPDFVEQIIFDEESQKAEALKRITRRRPEIEPALRAVQHRLQEYKLRSGIEPKHFSKRKIAEIAKTDELYGSYYWEYSCSAHADSIQSGRYFKLNQNGKIEGFVINPLPIDSDIIYYDATCLAFYGLKAFIDVFGMPKNEVAEWISKLDAVRPVAG